MITFEDLGIPLTHQKITPGNTATALSKYCYQYWRFRLDFTDGDVELTANSWIVGASSGAVARIVEVHADSGTWTDNTGYLVLDSWNGTAFQNAEEIKQAAQSTVANVSGTIKPWTSGYPYQGRQAQAALVIIYAYTALISITGATPDQTALVGTPMVANASILLRNYEAMVNFKTIDYTASSASIAQIDFFF